MNTNVVLNAVYESGYYTENYKHFQQSVTSILQDTGIADEVITEVIPEKQFYIQGRAYVSDTMNHMDAKMKFDEVSQLIDTTLDDYFTKKYIQLDENAEKEKRVIADQIIKSYQQWIRHPFVQEIATVKDTMNGWFVKSLIVIACCIILTIGLILWSSQYLYRGLMQLVYLGIASGTLNLLFSVLIQKRMNYTDLSPDYYVIFLKKYMNSGMNYFRFSAIIIYVVAIVCWMIAAQLKAVMNKKRHMRRSCDE